MNPDFLDLLAALVRAEARFLIVGAHALAAHGIPRATGDLDVWIPPDPANAERVWAALTEFGAPLRAFDLSAGRPDGARVVFQMGEPPWSRQATVSTDEAAAECDFGRLMALHRRQWEPVPSKRRVTRRRPTRSGTWTAGSRGY